jgi:seryl-tRNA synthetase
MTLYEIGRDYGLVISSIALSIWAVFKSRMRAGLATSEDVQALARVLQDGHADLQRQIDDGRHKRELLAKDIAGLPTYDVTNKLSEQLSELTAAFEGVKTEVRSIDDKAATIGSAVDRIEQHLLTQAGRRS